MVRSFLAKFSPKSERRLLALCLNNPDNDRDTNEWNKKAVRYLIKALGKDIRLVDQLEKAISQQSSKTKCVSVPKNLDKRLLIAHRRGLPQVIYCRLWRWPDLQSHHQIKAISSCESCDDSPPKVVEHPNENLKICINPYHYERIFPKPIDPVLVPYQRIPPDLSTSYEDSDTTGETKARPGNLQSLLFQSGPSQETYRNMVHDFVPPDPNQQYSQQRTQQQQQQQHTHPHQIQPLHPQQQPQQLPLQHQQHSPQQIPLQHQQQSPQQISLHQQHSPQQLPLQHQQHSPQQHSPQQHIQQHQQHSPQQHLQQQHSPQQHLQQHLQQQPHQQQQQFYPQHYGSPPLAEYQDVSTHQQQQQQQQQQQFVHSQDSSLQQQHRIPYGLAQGPSYQQHPQEQYHLPQPSTQYQPQYRSTSPHQSPGTLATRPQFHQLTTPMATEPARPYQFKNFKFGRGIQRAPGVSARHPYHHPDPHAYITSPFTYSAQPSSDLQISYQPYQIASSSESQLGHPHQQAQQQQSMPTATYTTTEDQPMQYQQTPYIYPTSEQQFLQSTDQEMQITYQDPQSLPMRRQRIVEVAYYEPRTSTAQDGDEPMQQTPIIIDIREVPYQEGQYWCSISYHEYDQRIGEKYHSNCKMVCVDGYTQPMCNDRFCIGGISNINRNQFTEWVRRRIGRGVRFSYVDGDIYVEGLSESSIFVSNPLLMDQSDDKVVDTVSKLTAGATTKVFSTSEFSDLLADAVTRGFESVYKLTNCCVVRVSFVKGWGRNYKRQSIFNTPCWVEVQLNGPLQWIDKVLRQMRPPIGGCGSTS